MVVIKLSVINPCTYNQELTEGNYGFPYWFIIDKLKVSNNKKASFNDAIREYNIAV